MCCKIVQMRRQQVKKASELTLGLFVKISAGLLGLMLSNLYEKLSPNSKLHVGHLLKTLSHLDLDVQLIEFPSLRRSCCVRDNHAIYCRNQTKLAVNQPARLQPSSDDGGKRCSGSNPSVAMETSPNVSCAKETETTSGEFLV